MFQIMSTCGLVTYFPLWLFWIGWIGTLQAQDEAPNLLYLNRIKLVFPGYHSFFRYTNHNNVEYFLDTASMDPVFIGHIWPNKALALRKVTNRAMFVIYCFTGR